MTLTFRYVPTFLSLDEAERWADEHGIQLGCLERGPDGRIRGTCFQADEQREESPCR